LGLADHGKRSRTGRDPGQEEISGELIEVPAFEAPSSRWSRSPAASGSSRTRGTGGTGWKTYNQILSKIAGSEMLASIIEQVAGDPDHGEAQGRSVLSSLVYRICLSTATDAAAAVPR
jgi:hypothetical protein